MKVLFCVTLILGIVAGILANTAPAAEVLLPTKEARKANKHRDNNCTFHYLDPITRKKTTYLAFKLPAKGLNDAKISCQSKKMRLASVETWLELVFLQSELREFVGWDPVVARSGKAAFWVAGTDLYANNTRGIGQYWIYDGSPIDASFWNPGEPNNYGYTNGRALETCVDLKIPYADALAPYGLNDEVCSEPLGYLCEGPALKD